MKQSINLRMYILLTIATSFIGCTSSFNKNSAPTKYSKITKAQVTKTQAAKAQRAKTQTVKAQAVKAQAAKAQAAKAQAAKAQAAKAQVAKAQVAKAQVAKAQVAKAQAAKAQVAKAQVAKAQSVNVEKGSYFDSNAAFEDSMSSSSSILGKARENGINFITNSNQQFLIIKK